MSNAVASFLFSQRPPSVPKVIFSCCQWPCEVAVPFEFAADFRRLHTCIVADIKGCRFPVSRFAGVCFYCPTVAKYAWHCEDGRLCVCVCVSPFPPSELELCLSSRSLVTLISAYVHCIQLNKSFPLLGTCGHAIHECE